MPTNTPNINLYKKNMTTDQAHTFNIDTMLNENWDKIDDAVGNLQTELKNNITQTTTLTNSTPTEHITAKQNCGVDVEVGGEMVVNLLGRNGDCEDVSKWNSSQATISLDASKKVYGSNAIKITLTNTAGGINKPISNFNMQTTKYYLMSAYLDKGNTTNICIAKDQTGGGVEKNASSTATTPTRVGVKIQPSDINSGNYLTVYAHGSAGQYAYVDGTMLTEITQSEYNTLTVDQLLAKYPYTNSAQPLLNPTVEVCGKNLIEEYKLANAFGTIGSVLTCFEDEKIHFKQTDTTGSHGGYLYFSVAENTKYTLGLRNFELMSGHDNLVGVVISLDKEFNELDSLQYFSIATTGYADKTITTPLKTKYLRTYLASYGTASITESKVNMICVKGSSIDSYEPYKGGQIIFPTELSKIGTYQDKLTYKDGVAKVDRKVKHMVLDGSLGYTLLNDYSGFKRVNLSSVLPNALNVKYGTKYDGSILGNGDTALSADNIGIEMASLGVLVSIADTDSGWGENYTPTANEIKAYFNGWKMFNQSQNNTSIYNGTGQKAWVEFKNVGKEGFGIPTLPTTSYEDFTPYQLYYALAEPCEEEIHPMILGDGFNLIEGQNTMTVKSGRVWEKVEPKVSMSFGNAYIAGNEVSQEMTSKLTYKNNKIVSIYKQKDNTMTDCTQDWVINKDNLYAHGVEIAYIPLSKFDAQSNYYVLYEVLHQDYDGQIQEATISYEGNIRQSLNEAVETLSNIQKDISKFHDNWYQINEAVEKTKDLSKNINTQTTTLTNSTPTEHITAKQNCGVDVQVDGEMVMNLLGKDGDCEDVSKWNVIQATVLLDTTKKVFGSNAIKITLTNTAGGINKPMSSFNMQTTKYYLMSAYLDKGNATDVYIAKDATGGGATKAISTTATTPTRVGVKIQPSDINSDNYLVIYAAGSVGQYAYVDGIMLTEITQSEYNTLTVDQLLTKYPYTNSAQPLLNPMVEVCGKNLVKNGNGEEGVNEWKNDKSSDDSFITIKYDVNEDALVLKHITGTVNWKAQKVMVKKNTDYTYTVTGKSDGKTGMQCSVYDFDLDIMIANIHTISNSKLSTTYISSSTTFNSGDREYVWVLLYANTTVGKVYYKEIQLEQGTISTPYEPYKGGQIIFPTELSKVYTYQDELTYKDGVAKVDRKVKHVILDGSLDWSWNADYTGFKRIIISPYIDGQVLGNIIVQKYNSEILQITSWNNPSNNSYYIDHNLFGLTIPDTDSGWGESYTPTSDEIKAYFNGWRMFVASTSGTPYNGTGTKNWAKLYSGEGTPVDHSGTLVISGSTVTTLPAILSPEHTPYQLYYALAEPTQEEIEPIILGDGVNLIEGQNTLTVKSGVVWEKAEPLIDLGNTNYFINPNLTIPGAQLKFKNNNIEEIYKENNGIIINDTKNWFIGIASDTDQPLIGINYAYIPKADFDPQANYYVLYEVLQEDYNCQVQEAEVSYENNIRGALNEVVEEVHNVQSDVSDIRVSLQPLTDKERAMTDVELLTTETTADIKNKINEMINILRGDQ